MFFLTKFVKMKLLFKLFSKYKVLFYKQCNWDYVGLFKTSWTPCFDCNWYSHQTYFPKKMKWKLIYKNSNNSEFEEFYKVGKNFVRVSRNWNYLNDQIYFCNNSKSNKINCVNSTNEVKESIELLREKNSTYSIYLVCKAKKENFKYE